MLVCNIEITFQVNLWKCEVSTPKADTTNITNVNGDTNDQLQAQVENYKKVLGETVSVLFMVLSKSFLVS